MAQKHEEAGDLPGGDAASAPSLTSTPKRIPHSKQRNAFTDLMSSTKPQPPKRRRSPPSSTPPSDPARATTFLGRDGLGAYIQVPGSFPPSRVIYHNEDFVVINDLFPKSSIHLLLLPRDVGKQLLHPFEAFEDPEFLAKVREELDRVKALAAKELKRRFGKSSMIEQAREKALEADVPADQIPEGRDWEKEIVIGVHAVPSMSHLHIHLLSRDRHSECLKHRKHYNSFATSFMVPIEDFPLDREDWRRHPGREGFLSEGMKCWRCGKDFGNKFQKLKVHLAEEFEAWRKE